MDLDGLTGGGARLFATIEIARSVDEMVEPHGGTGGVVPPPLREPGAAEATSLAVGRRTRTADGGAGRASEPEGRERDQAAASNRCPHRRGSQRALGRLRSQAGRLDEAVASHQAERTEHLPLSAAAVALLKRIAADGSTSDSLVFPGRSTEKPLVDLRQFWNAALSAADIEDYRIYDNRHTHASHLVSSGMSLAVVGRLLGHTNPMTTQRYAHLADDPLREAADAFGRKSGL